MRLAIHAMVGLRKVLIAIVGMGPWGSWFGIIVMGTLVLLIARLLLIVVHWVVLPVLFARHRPWEPRVCSCVSWAARPVDRIIHVLVNARIGVQLAIVCSQVTRFRLYVTYRVRAHYTPIWIWIARVLRIRVRSVAVLLVCITDWRTAA